MTLEQTAPKLDGVDYGMCRVYYSRNKLLYCFQEEFPGIFHFYRCSQDGEPSHQLPLTQSFLAGLPVPEQEGKWYEGFRHFVQKEKEQVFDTAIKS